MSSPTANGAARCTDAAAVGPALAIFARVLLDRTASPAELKSCCDGFYAECVAATAALGEQRSVLDSGLALSAQEAALCVLDFTRTAAFVRALDGVILKRLCRGAPVRVLYAGCGPLATLALPLAVRYPAAAVKFCLIDIHPASLDAARQLFAHHGLGDRIAMTICADAAQLQLPPMPRQDVLLMEVMQRSLAHEPQFAVVANLLPQCASDAELVPQRIVVSAALACPQVEFDPLAARVRIAPIALLELSRDILPALRTALEPAATRIPLPALRMPAALPPDLQLMLTTRIEASAIDVLGDYDSGLTYPQFLPNLGSIHANEVLQVAYRLGRNPGFEIWR
jgi:SAM-dependent methyltransferase